MIVELNGHSLHEARAAARRLLEKTNPRDPQAPVPRRYRLSDRAAKIERARMRLKVRYTKQLRAAVLDQLEQWRKDVLRAVTGHVHEADPISLATQLEQELDAAVQSGVLTDAQKQRYLARLDAAIKTMKPTQLSATLLQIQQEIYNAGVQSGAAEVGISWDLVPTVALQSLANDGVDLSDSISARMQTAIRSSLGEGIAAGESIPELAQRINDVFDDGVPVYDDAGNLVRTIPADAYAEMVARTETSSAMNAGTMATYHQAGVAKVMWVAADDERTCDECLDNDGEVVYLGQDFGDGVDSPPAHPSCRCTTVSADDDGDDDGDDDAAVG